MFKRLAVIILSVLVVSGYGQQDPQYSHDMFNYMAINPGYAGTSGEINATALSRQQWVGFKGAPKTTLLSLETALKTFGTASGAGLIISDDRLGFEKNFNAEFAYSYHLSIGQGNLGIGLEAGIINKAISGKWNSVDPADSDPLIPNETDRKMALDLGIGAFYTLNNLYLGISSTHLHQPKLQFAKGETYLRRHYYLMGGYNLQVLNSLIDLSPSVNLKYDGAVMQYNFNVIALYNKKFWGGVTYRNKDAIIGLIGIELINGIKLGYAYDFTLSQVRKNSSGSHEVMIAYSFNLGMDKTPQRYKSVRFL
jgi:type IX secretion system PorP/SprF family membrane protein